MHPGHPATAISVDITAISGSSGGLSETDTDVQLALDTLSVYTGSLRTDITGLQAISASQDIRITANTSNVGIISGAVGVLEANTTGITGGTWSPINGGNVEVSEDITSIDPAIMQLIHGRRVDQDDTQEITNPDATYGDLFIVHGDYIVVTIHRETGGAANAGATIEIEEEL